MTNHRNYSLFLNPLFDVLDGMNGELNAMFRWLKETVFGECYV